MIFFANLNPTSYFKIQQMCEKASYSRTLESVSDCYRNQMCDQAVDNYPYALKFVPDCYMNQKLCEKGVDTHPSTIAFVLLQKHSSLIAIRPKKCMIKLLIEVFLHLLIFLIDIKLKKCETELFLKILLS